MKRRFSEKREKLQIFGEKLNRRKEREREGEIISQILAWNTVARTKIKRREKTDVGKVDVKALGAKKHVRIRVQENVVWT